MESDFTTFRRNICNVYNIPDKYFEIHMSQLYKKQGKSVFHKQLILNELQQIYIRIYNSMIPKHIFKIISVVLQKDKLSKGINDNKIMSIALEDLLERIELCLLNEYHSDGIFFMDDMNKTKCENFRRIYKNVIMKGTYSLKVLIDFNHLFIF